MKAFAKSFRCIVAIGISFCLLVATQSANAVQWVGGTGNWNTASNWSNNAVPSGANDYGINNQGTAIIDSAASSVNDILLGWNANNQREGHLEIQTGGSITTTTTDGVYVGVKSTSTMSTLLVSGGSLTTTGGGWVMIGDETSSQGTVTLSSGSISIGGDLVVGRAGEGNLVIQGSLGSITVAEDLSFHVTSSAFSRLFVEIDAAGISPIQVAAVTTLDNSPELNVSLSALAPTSDLVLVDSSPTGSIVLGTTFFGLADGAPVSATLGLTTYNWTIDYDYGTDNNDIALVFVSVETVPEPGTATLGGLGMVVFSFVAARRRRARANQTINAQV